MASKPCHRAPSCHDDRVPESGAVRVCAWRSTKAVAAAYVFVALGLAFPGGVATASAQSPGENWARLTVAAGAGVRDTRDYDDARSLGLAASFGYEEAIGARSSVALNASLAGFQDKLGVATPLTLTSRLAIKPNSAATNDAWDPVSGSHGHSNLAVLGVDVCIRQYLTSGSIGPYVGAGAGVVRMFATAQRATRPSAGALVGYRWAARGRVHGFAEAHFTSMTFDLTNGFDAKSPRWVVTSLVGASIDR
jgi:hypothetical protein